MYAVAVSHGNAQVALAFQFLHEFVRVLKNYFGDFTEESIRNNFVLIYELLDEVIPYACCSCSTQTPGDGHAKGVPVLHVPSLHLDLIYGMLQVLDYGYPQNCSTDVLKLYITQTGDKSAAAERASSQV